ncbi:regulatory helix-turn-helix LysR family protein [Saccharothrix carnea]|uniref:Regulatory helix-turn-helix LysR family protein n=1 Tax=Saccharothrix carnea TaxID=1280637 RepID=A0A2P8HZH8_SACCR|nr:LysR family transcriptional regulator [Saccharothrix carnea]PSL51622.1 regulatory helix-turn-helix LysR family protein [Saccharothrix carnea]
MDVVEACKAFVAVSGHGSFTVGAAAARIPQSVASRRVAALERHFGARLLTRNSRSVTLTPFGREMLPSARRLVDLAEAMEHDAERAKLRPFRLAVPEVCAPRPLARLVSDARRHDLDLDPRPAGPAERAEQARTLDVRAALVAVPPDEGVWRVPLGLAGRADPGAAAVIHVETLRAGRAERDSRRRRVLIQPEDDVPHVRDRVTRLRDAVGLQPAQVVVAPSLVAATADVLGSADLLLCSPGQADDLGLHWRPVGELDLARGYDVTAGLREDARRIRDLPPAAIGCCLGVAEREA